MEAPVERIREEEPVENNSIEEMVKQMSLTIDKGLEDYKAEEKKVDSRIAAIEDSRAMATASASAAAATATEKNKSNSSGGGSGSSGRGSSNDSSSGSYCIGRGSIGEGSS